MNRSRENAFVLVAVLIVVLLASMVGLSLMFHVRTEELAATTGQSSEQAWATAMSGLRQAMAAATSITSEDDSWEDDPQRFRHQFVSEDGSDRWYYTIYTYGPPEGPGIRYGLTDLAGKLHVNHATEEQLLKLPKMTPALAQALLDYIDADNTPRPEGAEQDLYYKLPVPFVVPNQVLTSLDQILLVRGFTPALFYGEDANLNHQLDPNEDDGDEQPPPDDNNGALDRGLRQYLTVSSYEPNLDPLGQARMNINDPAEPLLDLAEQLVAYLDALHQNNLILNHPADLLDATSRLKDKNGAEIELASGVGPDQLPAILNTCTTTNATQLPGLININTANPWVLQTVPGIDYSLAQAIAAARRSLSPTTKSTPAWLITERLVDTPRFRQLAPHLTARSFQYRFQVIGYSLPTGRFRILEAEIDLASGQPVVTYLRDITRLGLPFPIQNEPEPDHA